MKLWVVLYLAGKIIGSGGPYDFSMHECEAQAASLMATFHYAATLPARDRGEPFRGEITAICEHHRERPPVQ